MAVNFKGRAYTNYVLDTFNLNIYIYICVYGHAIASKPALRLWNASGVAG